jgi:hypothetical protein
MQYYPLFLLATYRLHRLLGIMGQYAAHGNFYAAFGTMNNVLTTVLNTTLNCPCDMANQY